jgi:hypothetical protein
MLRKIIAAIMVLAGLVLLIGACGMEVSLPRSEVVNIGLLNVRQNLVIVGCSLLILGFLSEILSSLDKVQKTQPVQVAKEERQLAAEKERIQKMARLEENRRQRAQDAKVLRAQGLDPKDIDEEQIDNFLNS